MLSEGRARSAARMPGAPPADEAGQKRTLVSAAYQRLQGEIVRGALRPGERLRFNALSDTYGFSAAVLREALSRLVGDGFVMVEDQRGFSVATVSRAQLVDLLQMRLLIEEQGLRLAIVHGGVEWEVEVMSAFHRLAKTQNSGDADPRLVHEEWERRHDAFHRALVAACGSPLLLQYRESLVLQGQRYRRLYHTYVERERDHLGEHRRIMELALQRDADETVRVVRAHLEKTVRDLLDSNLMTTPDGVEAPA